MYYVSLKIVFILFYDTYEFILIWYINGSQSPYRCFSCPHSPVFEKCRPVTEISRALGLQTKWGCRFCTHVPTSNEFCQFRTCATARVLKTLACVCRRRDVRLALWKYYGLLILMFFLCSLRNSALVLHLLYDFLIVVSLQPYCFVVTRCYCGDLLQSLHSMSTGH